MTIFTHYLNYINAMGGSYVTTNAAIVANAITPAVTALLSLYIILWGVSYLRGEMREPITEAATRIAKIALILGIGLQLGNYNQLVVDTFLNGPEELGRMLAGASDNSTSASSMDAVLATGYSVAKGFLDKGGLLSGDFGMYILGFTVMLVTVAVTVYSFALIILSKIMLFLLIALGPLFIISLLFQASAGYFTAWIHKMANFSLLSILVIAVNIMIITLFQRTALQAVSSTQLDAILPMLITGILAIIALSQLTTVAAGLAGGLSMSSQGMGRMGLSVLASSAGKAASLAKMGAQRIPIRKSFTSGKTLKIQRDSSPSRSENRYENRDNHLGRA